MLKDTPSEHLAIISFNFDVLLYEDFEAGVYFDYLLDFDWMDHNREKIYARNNPIKLLKLNGSLDWGICPSCNRLHLYFPPMSRRFFDDKRCSEQCVGRIQPFIIIPHEKYKQQIEQLWSSAEEELKRAATVTVIGYSFPQYDEKVAQIFSKSLRPRTRLLVVDHCDRLEDKSAKEKAIRDKYRKLFPMLEGEIELYLNGFSGYVDTQTN